MQEKPPAGCGVARVKPGHAEGWVLESGHCPPALLLPESCRQFLPSSWAPQGAAGGGERPPGLRLPLGQSVGWCPSVCRGGGWGRRPGALELGRPPPHACSWPQASAEAHWGPPWGRMGPGSTVLFCDNKASHLLAVYPFACPLPHGHWWVWGGSLWPHISCPGTRHTGHSSHLQPPRDATAPHRASRPPFLPWTGTAPARDSLHQCAPCPHPKGSDCPTTLTWPEPWLQVEG